MLISCDEFRIIEIEAERRAILRIPAPVSVAAARRLKQIVESRALTKHPLEIKIDPGFDE